MLELIELKSRNTVKTVAPTNHVFVVDVSYSMYRTLPLMREHLKNNLVSLIKENDTISIVYFSGPNQCGSVLKAEQISSLQDLSNVQNAIDRFLTPIGCTSFVNPIELSISIAKSINNNNMNNFIMMTDGFDNCSSKSKILDVVEQIPTAFDKSTFIEYGYYCDRELLKQMSSKIGANHVFVEDYKAYEPKFVETITQKPVNMVEVKVNKQSSEAVYIEDNNIVTVTAKDGIVRVPETVSKVYSITKTNISEKSSDDLKYVALYYSVSKADNDLTYKCLKALGDVYLINEYNNVFTKQDFSNYAELVKRCVFDENERYVDGKDYDHIPKDDATTVLDVLNIIASNKGNFLDTGSEIFSYTKTTKSRKEDTSDDSFWMPKFVANETDGLVDLHKLVYNSNRANISINTTQSGVIALPRDKCNDYMLPSFIETFRYKNYTVVKDGIIHMKELPVRLTDETAQKVKEVAGNALLKTGDCDYVLMLTKLPLINRNMVKNLEAKSFFTSCIKVQEIKAKQKVLKYFKDMYVGVTNAKGLADKYGKDAAAWLSSVGIRDYGFNFAKTTVDDDGNKDFYMTKELNVKIKGLSSIPAVKKTIEKAEEIQKGNTRKKLNIAETLLVNAYDEIEPVISQMDDESRKQYLEQETNKVVQLTRTLDQIVAKIVYAVICGKAWFKDFDSYEQDTLTIDYEGFSVPVTVSLEEKKQYF